MSVKKLILASGSPRRRELLIEAGYTFRTLPSRENVETAPEIHEHAVSYVMRQSREKARDVAMQVGESSLDGKVILACDTIVVCGEMILGKPENREDASRMLRHLRGKEHSVISGVCILSTGDDGGVMITEESVETRLKMDVITDAELETYLDSGLWAGKAGAFGYQDGPSWLHLLSGDETNIVGLPMQRLHIMLEKAGVQPEG